MNTKEDSQPGAKKHDRVELKCSRCHKVCKPVDSETDYPAPVSDCCAYPIKEYKIFSTGTIKV